LIFTGIFIFIAIPATITAQDNSTTENWSDTVIVKPVNPNNHNHITITFSGWFYNSCGQWLEEPAISRFGNRFVIEGSPAYIGVVCLQVLVPWTYTYDVGLLSPGEYTIETIQNWPNSTEVDYYDFSVANAPCCRGIRGNVDGLENDHINIIDLTYLVEFLFNGGDAPPCIEEADIDGNRLINIVDLTMLILYVFQGGEKPLPCQ